MASITFGEQPEVLGKNTKKLRIREQNKVNNYATEMDKILKALKASASSTDIESALISYNRILELLRASDAFGRIAPDWQALRKKMHDAMTSYSGVNQSVGRISSNYVNAQIAQVKPALASNQIGQVQQAISMLEQLKTTSINNIPRAVLRSMQGQTGIIMIDRTIKKLNTRLTELSKRGGEMANITAQAEGQTNALINEQNRLNEEAGGGGADEDKPNYILPIAIGGGALALFLALKG